ncbi:MAG: glycosyltransferase family 2 protein [Synergistaceae bacterium]|nr:glycosyltransferase family 2 protein [Synergistaceae bacterium]
MKCGLVILNYKDYKMTQKLLDTVKDYPEINHIAVVDNNSPNESYEVLKQYESDKITVLKSDRNGGYSYGNNIGIRHLIKNFSPDIIAIANPDVIFSNELVRRIKETFESNPDYAVLTGFQLDAKNKTGCHPFWQDNQTTASSILKPMLYGLAISPFVKLFRKVFRIRKANSYGEYLERIKNSPEVLNQVYAVEGCLFFIRTKDFESVGLFDEKIFLFCEEELLAKKIKALGKKAGVLNDITFIHAHKEHKNKNPFTFSILERGQIFYFCNYITESKTLHAVYIILMYLLRLKRLLKESVKKLISPFRK